MKQIIPLKKDIIFKTKIGKITNINISKDYKIKDDLIDGYINVYGTYKMTEASVLEEEFNYKIPFGVSISKNILKDTINIEINDFNYKVDKDILSVEVDLDFECDEYIENNNEIKLDDNIVSVSEEDNKDIDNSNIEINNSITENKIEENINNITNIINNEEKYHIYKVYIVRQGDTINDICNKYNVNINDLKEYNDINNIGIGDKIIIPYINE